MDQPLVSGGILNQDRYTSESSPPRFFTSTTLPAIYDNSVIIAATHPNVFMGHPSKDGWFISDFYAFNYLLKGLGSSQLWLTAADPHKLLKAHPSYLHGNPFQERKVVLDDKLLNSGEITPVTVVPTARMIDRFLSEVRTASRRAKHQEAPLLLLVFCHGLSNYTMLLDNGNKSKGLTTTRLKEAIEPGCRVTLVSISCYSGGWVQTQLGVPSHTPLKATMLSASDKTFNAWQISRSVGRSCGSVFASSLIQALSSASSPLLAHQDDGAPESDLQPEEPDINQTMTHNAFCQSILDICRDEVHRLWHIQGFTFGAQDDKWDHSWTGRTGIPLGYFKQRWDALPTFPYTGPPQVKLDVDPDPSNPSFQGSAGPSQTGGFEIVDE